VPQQGSVRGREQVPEQVSEREQARQREPVPEREPALGPPLAQAQAPPPLRVQAPLRAPPRRHWIRSA
jgi:hypothetical protein